MSNVKVVNRTGQSIWRKMVLMVAVLFLVAGPAGGGGSLVASSGSSIKESKGNADSPSPSSPGRDHQEKEDSPVIGGGIRIPPDIGASGTASPTPPVRTESPTDEPPILPDVSPVPVQPSDTDISPALEGQPLGQPDPLQKKKKMGGSIQ